MGMVLGFAALISFAISFALGIIGFVFFIISKRKNAANLFVYLLSSLLIPLVYLGGVSIYANLFSPESSGGAPTGEQYSHWFFVAVLFGFFPGIGSFIAGTVLLIRSFSKTARQE